MWVGSVTVVAAGSGVGVGDAASMIPDSSVHLWREIVGEATGPMVKMPVFQ